MPFRLNIRPIPATCACALALALLPARWVAPWTADLSSILWIPLMPVSHVLSGVRSWLRPPVGPGMLDAGSAARMQGERDMYRGLWHSERLRAAELEAQLRLVAQITRGSDAEGAGLVIARIVRDGIVAGTCLIDAGSANGVQPGDPVLAEGDLLLGRIAGEVERWTCVLEPLDSPSTGRLEARILLSGRAGAGGETRSVRVQLSPDGAGVMVGDMNIDSTFGTEISVGDEVRLDDPTWPLSARGMRIGTVDWLGRKDEQPLRGLVQVRLAIDPSRAGQVVIRTRIAQGVSP